jgi:hypothetical protein
MIYTNFVLPNGEVYRKQGGVPSGCGLTSLVTTIVSGIVMEEYMSVFSNEYGNCVVWDHHETGDNVGLYITWREIPWPELQDDERAATYKLVWLLGRYLTQSYGLKIAEDKSVISSQSGVRTVQPNIPGLSRDMSS